MKRLMTYCMFSALTVFATSNVMATSVTIKGTDANEASNAKSNVTASIFADDLSTSAAPTYDIFTNNIFADDVFTDDVASNDVLIASLITPNMANANGAQQGVSNIELSTEARNGKLSMKTESEVKLYYYTDAHTDKDGNIINGGTNTLFVKKIVSPGVYLCRYEGADGSTKDVKVVCKL